MIGGERQEAEIDGGYFGGYVKPANLRENRRDRRHAKNQTGKRQVVVIVRERDGKTLPAVFRTEAEALRVHPRARPTRHHAIRRRGRIVERSSRAL